MDKQRLSKLLIIYYKAFNLRFSFCDGFTWALCFVHYYYLISVKSESTHTCPFQLLLLFFCIKLVQYWLFRRSIEPLRSFPLPKDRVFCVPDGTIMGLFREEPPSILMPASTTLLLLPCVVRLPVFVRLPAGRCPVFCCTLYCFCWLPRPSLELTLFCNCC